MGLFDFFSKKKVNQLDTKLPKQPAVQDDEWEEEEEDETPEFDAEYLMEKIEVIPGLVLPRAFADHWPELSQSKTNFIKINAIPSDDLSLQQSKFGSYPMLPVGFEYPKDQQGNFMFPLAQINFRQMPYLQGYPRTGYLQFYIAIDPTFGLRFDGQQNDFKVLFFEEQEVEHHQTDFGFLELTMSSAALPVYKPHAVSFELKEEYFGVENVVNKMNPGITLDKIAGKFDEELEEELMEFAYDNFSHNDHKIGGYAYFTQDDPRIYNAAIKDFVLLFQVNSDIEIMWGDSGVANFFIHPNDLAKKDFSKVFYTWDCC